MTDLVVQDRKHAWISPSSFGRAEQCTKSVQLSTGAVAREVSYDALVGTAAHAVLEHCLEEELDTFELSDVCNVQIDGKIVQVDSEMLDGVQLYLDFVRHSDLLKGRKVLVEQLLHLNFAEEYLGRPMFGYADLLAPDLPVVVVDYKNGFNPVSADSVQLGLYVLAAVLSAMNEESRWVPGAVAGTAVIVQPRAQGDKIKIHEWTYTDLWVLKDRVVELLRRISTKDYTYKFGDHCRWCPAAGVCPHLAALARDTALAHVAPSPEMVASGEISVTQLDRWLEVTPIIDHWLRQMQATAEDYLVHGGKLSNGKLVRKRSTRRWTDEKDAEALLRGLGVDPWQKKLVTPSEAERRLPKTKIKEIADLVEKPVGELTLVMRDDPRDEVNVGATLRAALEGSIAVGYLAAVQTRKEQTAKGEQR